MTEEELKRYDLIVEYVNRAKLAMSRDDRVEWANCLLEAQERLNYFIGLSKTEGQTLFMPTKRRETES